MTARAGVLAWLFAAALCAQTGPFELRAGDETVPAGALVQLKFSLTDPQPITSGRGAFDMDFEVLSEYEGISVYSKTGDAAGAAVIRGTRLAVTLLSPASTLGTEPDYPILTAVIRTKPTAPAGYRAAIALDPSSVFTAPGGQSYATVFKPGTLTIGGSLSVGNVIPGAGVLPAGATVRIVGSGFVPGTRVDISEVAISAARVISGAELEVTLAQPAEIGGRRIRVRNPDNSQVTYFSYLRSRLMTPPTSRSLLAAAVPLFSSTPRSTGTLQLTGAAARFDALALENQTQADVAVALELAGGAGATAARAVINLPSGFKYVHEVSEIFGGLTASAGSLRVAAGAPIRMLGLRGDEQSGTVQAVLLTQESPASSPLRAAPVSLSFSAIAGGSQPPSQSVSLTSAGPALAFTASSSPWISLSPAAGTTPAVVSVSVNPAGLSPGTYQGAVTISPPPPAAALSIPVQLTVTAAVPAVRSLVNSATQLAGPVAPGELVSLYGDFPGTSMDGLRLTASGAVDTVLGGARVLFDGVPAPMVFSSAGQLNVIVPYEMEGRAAVSVVVESGGVRSAPVSLAVGAASPGIFTADGSGRGQAAVVNADGSINGLGSPAPRGSVVYFYATGEGPTNPPSFTGAVAEAANPKVPRGAVSALVGGLPAQVLYAGSAPGLAAGVMQVNLVIPPGAAPGPAALSIRVGDASSPPGATIVLQ